jgi:hypothetical protein
MSKTIWRVQPINASFHPAILVRCPLCNACGEQDAPHEKFLFQGRHWQGSVQMGTKWAQAFVLKHHPICKTVSKPYEAVEAAEKELAAAEHKMYLLEEAALQLERELDRGYISKLPPTTLSQIQDRWEAARIGLVQGRAHHEPEIERAKARLADAQTALDNARGESVPKATIAEFQKAMAKYLPLEDAQPEAPGQRRPAFTTLHV